MEFEKKIFLSDSKSANYTLKLTENSIKIYFCCFIDHSQSSNETIMISYKMYLFKTYVVLLKNKGFYVIFRIIKETFF